MTRLAARLSFPCIALGNALALALAAAPDASANDVTFAFESTTTGACDDPVMRHAWSDATLLELGPAGVERLLPPSAGAPADLVAVTLAWSDCTDPRVVDVTIADPARRLRLVQTIDLGDVPPEMQARTIGLVTAELYRALMLELSPAPAPDGQSPRDLREGPGPLTRRARRFRDRATLALAFDATLVPSGSLGLLGGGAVVTVSRLGGLPLALSARLGATVGSARVDTGTIDLWTIGALVSLGLANGNDDLAWSLGPAVDAAVVHVRGTPSDPTRDHGTSGFGPRVAVGGYASFQLRAAGPLFATLGAFVGGTVASTRATFGSAVVLDGSGLVVDVSLGVGLTL